MRGRLARNLYSLGIASAYAEKPDLEAAERLLKESAADDPTAFFVHIELGNINLKQGLRDAALQAYGTRSNTHQTTYSCAARFRIRCGYYRYNLWTRSRHCEIQLWSNLVA